MPVAQGNIVRVTAKMKSEPGSDLQNVYYFRNEGLGNVVDSLIPDDLGAFLDDLYGNIIDHLVASMTFESISYFDVTDNRPLADSLWPTRTTGGGSGNGLPTGVALLVGLNTGVLRVHGRKYLGQMQESDSDGSGFLSSVVTAAAAYGAQLIGSFIGAGSANVWLPGIIDKNGDFWAFEEAKVSSVHAYQRRRRFGTGS